MSGAPQLLYALTTEPFPLQASPAQGDLVQCVLTVVASNPAPDPDANPVTLAGVEITLPIGAAAGDLTPDATGVGPFPPPGWQLQPNTPPGVYAFVPAGPPRTTVSVGAEPLAFGLEAVLVNRAPGPVAGLRVIEGTAGMPSVELPLTKFPSGWGSVEFWANPPDIDFGQSTTLHWSGPPGATYAIEYAAGGDVVNLPPAGQPPFASNGVWPGANDPPLAPAETTVFTLTVEETIGSEQYATRVQETVTVVRPGPRIERFAGTLAVAAGGGYAVTFEWATQSADHCQLSGVEYLLPTASPPGGYSVPASPPWNAGYVLEAIGNGATASSTLSAAWQTRSTTDIPADMASDLALSPDGSLLYVAVAQDLLIYSVPASAEGPLPEPGSFPEPPYGVEPARLAGAGPGPAQSVWASFAYEESLIALLAVEEGGLFERGGTAVSVSPTLPAIAATKGGARVYAAVAGTVSAYDSDLASNVTLAWTASCATGAGLAASADGSLYVASDVLAAYTVDDAGTDHLVPAGSLSLGGATATGVAVAGGVVFVALGTSVLVADRAGMQPLAAPIPVAADRIAVSPDGLRLYALDIAAGTVAVLSPTPLTGGVAG